MVATDRGSPALSATVTVDVRVMDVNDNSPVFSKSSYMVDVSEDAEQGSQVLEVCRNKYYGDSKYVFVFFRHLTY